jgi:hypothetical protein
VHGLFRASGIVMIYRCHHAQARPRQLRTPGSLLESTGGSVLESAEAESDPNMDLRDEIQRIAVEWPCYGWRRVHAELWRRGWMVNHMLGHAGVVRECSLMPLCAVWPSPAEPPPSAAGVLGKLAEQPYLGHSPIARNRFL